MRKFAPVHIWKHSSFAFKDGTINVFFLYSQGFK